MKRAEVCADRWHPGRGGLVGTWSVYLFPAEHPREEGVAIIERDPEPAIHWEGESFPTHAEALAYALAEVGLTEKNTEKETNR